MAMDHPRKGEWYWGAKCPQCGELTPHAHDPTRGEGDASSEGSERGNARTPMRCPNGHAFDAWVKDLVNFEWGAQ